jgi:hypothetical protein
MISLDELIRLMGPGHELRVACQIGLVGSEVIRGLVFKFVRRQKAYALDWEHRLRALEQGSVRFQWRGEAGSQLCAQL